MDTSAVPMEKLPPEALSQIAAYFQVLAEPTRLRILNLLREGEKSVGELAQLMQTSAANTSRHLTLMAQHGLVARESRGNSAYYAIADQAVYALCDVVCTNIANRFSQMDAARAPFVALAAAQAVSR